MTILLCELLSIKPRCYSVSLTVWLMGHLQSHRTTATNSMRRVALLLTPGARRLSADKAGIAQLPAVDECVEKLGSTFRNHFVSKLTRQRTVGREAEFPVVNAADGSIADVRKLLAKLDEAGDLKLKQVGDHGLYGDEYEYR